MDGVSFVLPGTLHLVDVGRGMRAHVIHDPGHGRPLRLRGSRLRRGACRTFLQPDGAMQLPLDLLDDRARNVEPQARRDPANLLVGQVPLGLEQ
jgi:hypothetical protein